MRIIYLMAINIIGRHKIFIKGDLCIKSIIYPISKGENVCHEKHDKIKNLFNLNLN